MKEPKVEKENKKCLVLGKKKGAKKKENWLSKNFKMRPKLQTLVKRAISLLVMLQKVSGNDLS